MTSGGGADNVEIGEEEEDCHPHLRCHVPLGANLVVEGNVNFLLVCQSGGGGSHIESYSSSCFLSSVNFASLDAEPQVCDDTGQILLDQDVPGLEVSVGDGRFALGVVVGLVGEVGVEQEESRSSSPT